MPTESKGLRFFIRVTDAQIDNQSDPRNWRIYPLGARQLSNCKVDSEDLDFIRMFEEHMNKGGENLMGNSGNTISSRVHPYDHTVWTHHIQPISPGIHLIEVNVVVYNGKVNYN